MERGGGHGRDAVDPAEDVVVGRREAGDLERGRDEDRAVQPDAGALLEHPREAADAVAAVALARDEHRRAPAAVLGEPATHELAKRLEVALVPEVLLRVGGVLRLRALLGLVLLLRLDDAAEAGAHRVDEHEVGEREPGRLVLDEPRGHRRQRPVRREVDALRADRTHVQVGRSGSGPAVEDEGHGSVAIALPGDVRDREDLGRRLLLLAQHSPLPGRRVLDGLAAAPPRSGGLGALRRLVIRLALGCLVRRLVAHGRARYRLLHTSR